MAHLTPFTSAGPDICCHLCAIATSAPLPAVSSLSYTQVYCPHSVTLAVLPRFPLSRSAIRARIGVRVQDELTPEDFASQREELVKSVLEKPRKLQTLAGRWFPEIILARHDWRRVHTEADALRSLTRDDLLAFVDDILMSKEARGRLCLNVVGSAERQRRAEGEKRPNSEASAEDATREQHCSAINAPASPSAAQTAANASQVNGSGAGSGSEARDYGHANGKPPVNGKAAVNGACQAADHEHGGHTTAGPSWGGDIVAAVAPTDLAQFRMRRETWALARSSW